jgi:hypothetical protein
MLMWTFLLVRYAELVPKVSPHLPVTSVYTGVQMYIRRTTNADGGSE